MKKITVSKKQVAEIIMEWRKQTNCEKSIEYCKESAEFFFKIYNQIYGVKK